MRVALCVVSLALLLGGTCVAGPPYFIPGTGTLPDCDEAPAQDLTGRWFDYGTVTIETEGCRDASKGEVFPSCSLDWEFTQIGNDVDIFVDNEYTINGRFCGDELHLEGGWWLPVEDEDIMQCTYENDSAAEVGIQAGGNVLTLDETEFGTPALIGTLVVQERCRATYEITLEKATL